MKRRLIVVGVAAILGWTSIVRADQTPPRLRISAAAVESVVQASIKADQLAAVSFQAVRTDGNPSAAMAQAGGAQTQSWFQQNWKWVVPVVAAVITVAIIAATGGYSSNGDSPNGDSPY